jgi:hypothetical protein
MTDREVTIKQCLSSAHGGAKKSLEGYTDNEVLEGTRVRNTRIALITAALKRRRLLRNLVPGTG